jgi:hypothetical protein
VLVIGSCGPPPPLPSHNMNRRLVCAATSYSSPSSESKSGASGSSIPFQQWDRSKCRCSLTFRACRRHLTHSHNLPMHMQLTMADSGRAKRWRGHAVLWSVKPPAMWSSRSPKCRQEQHWVEPEQRRQASVKIKRRASTPSE